MTDLISRAAAIKAITLGHTVTQLHAAICTLPAVAASHTADPAVKTDSCQRVTVKPLVWVKNPKHKVYYATIFGWYGDDVACYIIESETNETEWRAYLNNTMAGENYPSLELAKAALQANYDALILAAIETQPDPRDAVIAQLVEALEAAEELYQAGLLGASPDLIDAVPRLRAAALAAAKGGAA